MTTPEDHSPEWKEGGRTTRARPSSTPPSGMAVERLTDDLLVEILSRVPARSLCRFKCVSTHWLVLINHSDYRKRLPQTLAGFFYSDNITSEWLLEPPFLFASVSGRRSRPPIDTSFAFLPNHRRINLLDCSNGLLLCGWYDDVSVHGDEFHYVVCNPATEKWVVLPDSGIATNKVGTVRLGFDPAVSSHFHVFELVGKREDQYYADLAGVAVYSSESGGWVYKEIPFDKIFRLINHQSAIIFLNGYLHFLVHDRKFSDRLAVVDTTGETWMNFDVPASHFEGLIQRSQGRLHYAISETNENRVGRRLVVYVLDGYDSKEWIPKHSVQTSCVFQGRDVWFNGDFEWVAIHPEYNLIFFTVGRWDNAFMCYDMDRRKVKLVSKLEEGQPPYLPYVPLYAELESLHVCHQ